MAIIRSTLPSHNNSNSQWSPRQPTSSYRSRHRPTRLEWWPSARTSSSRRRTSRSTKPLSPPLLPPTSITIKPTLRCRLRALRPNRTPRALNGPNSPRPSIRCVKGRSQTWILSSSYSLFSWIRRNARFAPIWGIESVLSCYDWRPSSTPSWILTTQHRTDTDWDSDLKYWSWRWEIID